MKTNLCVICLLLFGCASGPNVEPNSIRAYTPPKYQELRLLLLRPSGADIDVWKLVFGYEGLQNELDKELIIQPRDPLSVVVGDVYLPADFSGTKDIVVLVDILTSDDEGLQSFAVWYQRGVRGGQKLGFDSLLVHSNRSWSPLTPPRFTVRVIDVTKEKNAETRTAMEGLNKAVGSMATFIPHPAVPAAAAAIRVAGLVAANRSNVPIIDFTPQFYGADFVSSSGPSDIPLFMRGTWLAVGREPGAGSEFWTNKFHMNRRTGQLFDARGRHLKVPYMRVTMSTAETIVPQIVLTHSKALFELLSEARTSGEVVDAVTLQLGSSLQTFNLHKDFLNNRTKASLSDIMAKLFDAEITAADKSFLLTVVNRTLNQNFGTADQARTWWQANNSAGEIDTKTGKWKTN